MSGSKSFRPGGWSSEPSYSLHFCEASKYVCAVDPGVVLSKTEIQTLPRTRRRHTNCTRVHTSDSSFRDLADSLSLHVPRLGSLNLKILEDVIKTIRGFKFLVTVVIVIIKILEALVFSTSLYFSILQ